MYTIKGQNYHNDYSKQDFTMKFNSLDAIFRYMKDISGDFADKYGTIFPTDGWCYGEWIRRISCRNQQSHYEDFWIHMISTENGIIYSDGHYTDSKKFCSDNVKKWLFECNEYVNNRKFNFINE